MTSSNLVGVYYYYLNKLNEFGFKIDNYNKFNIIVGKKNSVNYIKSHPDIIINNDKFSINLNNINVSVFIRDDTVCNFENDLISLISLNNINVPHNNRLFEYVKFIVNKTFNETILISEFNYENLDESIKLHQNALQKLLCFKTLEKINKLMNEQQTQEALLHTTQLPVPSVPTYEANLSLLLDAASYIDNQAEPPAKRK
jgi:hypothetical protein